MALKLSMATRWGSSLSTRWIICTSVCSTPLLRRSRLAGDDRHRPRGNPTRTAVVQQHVDRAANPHGMSPTLTAARKKRVACSAATPKSPASCHNSALLPRDPRRIRFQGMHIRSFWGRFSLPLPAKSFSLAEEERSYGYVGDHLRPLLIRPSSIHPSPWRIFWTRRRSRFSRCLTSSLVGHAEPTTPDRDQGMEMRVEVHQISEDLDGDDQPGNGLAVVRHSLKEGLLRVMCALEHHSTALSARSTTSSRSRPRNGFVT